MLLNYNNKNPQVFSQTKVCQPKGEQSSIPLQIHFPGWGLVFKAHKDQKFVVKSYLKQYLHLY